MAAVRSETVLIPPANLGAQLRAPAKPVGLVIFAHGSGSSRFSPRNQRVADALGDAGFATLLLDLLSEPEAAVRGNVFDIPLLGRRLVAAIDWSRARPDLAALPIGLFGASTGAAAALVAAAARPDEVGAVVSRGGRPDLASGALREVRAPTLLIVGGADEPVLSWNREALQDMLCPGRLEIVPGATHLFEEPGALDQVIALSCEWLLANLAKVGATARG